MSRSAVAKPNYSQMLMMQLFWWGMMIFTVQLSLAGAARGQDQTPAPKKWKVLHVMSYHSPWKWTDEQFAGFKDQLKGMEIEYKVFQMDTKRNNSEAWKQKKGAEAMVLVEAWKPDLVYTTDDYAQEYVTKHYLNKDIPFVFSGVNADPGKYGFVGSANVTGVLEQEHFVESVALLRQIVPSVRRIAVIYDDDPTWGGVLARMQAKLATIPDLTVTSWELIRTYQEFQARIKKLEQETDAIALLGIFTFKDEQGQNVSYREVLHWVADNSRLPDFSFWKDRISYGTLCTVTVSEYEQGVAAGKIARAILLEGRSPQSFSMLPTIKGEPVINLYRANKLGLKIKAGILLSAQVYNELKKDN